MKELLKKYSIITLGCAVYAVGFCWCCVPGHLSIGGLTGVAQVINVFFPSLPVGIMTLVMNVPLFILGWRLLGKGVLISSLYAMALSSLMIDGINAVFTFPALEPILAAVYGGILCGAAFGLMLRQGATTGGTELAARLLKLKVQQLPIGKLCLAIDLIVILAYSLTFRQLEIIRLVEVGVLDDVVAARLDLVAHQDGNAAVSQRCVLNRHLHQFALGRIHRRRPELFGVH